MAEDRLPGSASCSVGRGLQGRLRGAWDFPVPGPGVQGPAARPGDAVVRFVTGLLRRVTLL